MLLADRTHKITPPGTSKMRELANALERPGIDVINFAAGELDGDTSDPMKSGARVLDEIAGIRLGQSAMKKRA
jgi:aspartate aminotransferase